MKVTIWAFKCQLAYKILVQASIHLMLRSDHLLRTFAESVAIKETVLPGKSSLIFLVRSWILCSKCSFSLAYFSVKKWELAQDNSCHCHMLVMEVSEWWQVGCLSLDLCIRIIGWFACRNYRQSTQSNQHKLTSSQSSLPTHWQTEVSCWDISESSLWPEWNF